MQIEGTITAATVDTEMHEIMTPRELEGMIPIGPRRTKLTVEVVGDVTGFLESVFRSSGKITLNTASIQISKFSDWLKDFSIADALSGTTPSSPPPPPQALVPAAPVQKLEPARGKPRFTDVPKTPSDW